MLFQSVCQGCLLSPLLYVLTLEPLLSRLRDRVGCTALDGIVVPGGAQARVSVYTNDISIFMSCHDNIEVVQKV